MRFKFVLTFSLIILIVLISGPLVYSQDNDGADIDNLNEIVENTDELSPSSLPSSSPISSYSSSTSPSPSSSPELVPSPQVSMIPQASSESLVSLVTVSPSATPQTKPQGGKLPEAKSTSTNTSQKPDSSVSDTSQPKIESKVIAPIAVFEPSPFISPTPTPTPKLKPEISLIKKIVSPDFGPILDSTKIKFYAKHGLPVNLTILFTFISFVLMLSGILMLNKSFSFRGWYSFIRNREWYIKNLYTNSMKKAVS